MSKKYTVGELSKLSGINKNTLRLYDKKGLIVPFERGNDNNYRYYSEQQVIEAIMIREMKRRGLYITEIKQILKSNNLKSICSILDEKIHSLELEIKEIEQKIEYSRFTKDLISSVKDDSSSPREHVTIDTMPEMPVLFQRSISKINANKLFWDRYNNLILLSEKEKVTPIGPITAIFYDNYFNQFFYETGDLELYMRIKEKDKKGKNIRNVGGFLRASTIFVGWYAELLPIYVELVKQIDKMGYKIIGPAYEEYLVEFSHGVPDNECVTRVSFPIGAKEND